MANTLTVRGRTGWDTSSHSTSMMPNDAFTDPIIYYPRDIAYNTSSLSDFVKGISRTIAGGISLTKAIGGSVLLFSVLAIPGIIIVSLYLVLLPLLLLLLSYFENRVKKIYYQSTSSPIGLEHQPTDAYLDCRHAYEYLDDYIRDYDGRIAEAKAQYIDVRSHIMTRPLYHKMDKIVDHMRGMHSLLGTKLTSLDQNAPRTDILIPLTEDQLWQNRNPAYPYLI